MSTEKKTKLAHFGSMKLDKSIVQRRLDLMAAEGVVSLLLLINDVDVNRSPDLCSECPCWCWC